MQTTPANPEWIIYALLVASAIALLISLTSVITAVYSSRVARRSARATVEQTILNYKNMINDSFAKYRIRGPFAHILKIPEDRLDHYIPKTALFFFQLHLLEYVFRHRDLLHGGDDISAYASWAKEILTPWICEDDELRRNFALFCDTKDNARLDFIRWVQGLIRCEPQRCAPPKA